MLFKFIKFIKKVSSNKFPKNPLFPLIVSQYVSVWKTVKNNVPVIEYRIIKNKLSTIYKIFLSIITDRDIKKKKLVLIMILNQLIDIKYQKHNYLLIPTNSLFQYSQKK